MRGASAFRETTANPPSASDLDALASAAVSDEVLSEAIKSVDQSAFSVIGANQRALVGLRTNLHVKVDAVAGKVEIEMTSKFPHEASRLVDSVINTLLSSNNPAINLGDGSATQNLKSIYLGIPANPDVNPIGPSRSMLLLTAAGAGLILGIALVLVRASLDRRIVSPAQILEWTGLQTAGFLPTLPRRSSPAGRSLAAHIDPTSEAAHSCRALLLNLFGGRVNEQRGSVLVTSPSPGEGRSTVALNLAATLALAGEPVLLVDADMHSPIQHKLLTQADAQLGFCEALDNPSAATEFVRSTHVPNLFLLPRGNLSSTSAARLHGRNAGVVINELRSRYRYILFDSGPVLTNPDTTALAVRCNATILVLNAQKTSLQKAAQAKQLLTRHREGVGGDRERSTQRPAPGQLHRRCAAACAAPRRRRIVLQRSRLRIGCVALAALQPIDRELLTIDAVLFHVCGCLRRQHERC